MRPRLDTIEPAKRRDWRIDWLRGAALASIFVNHMPGNRFENWTSRNFGFSDAAEVFVLLAGVAASLAYFKRFDVGSRREISFKATRRAGTLYLAHIGSTFAAILLFAMTARLAANPDFLDLIGIAPLFEAPWPGIVGLLTGGYQLGYFNILPMYVVLLLALPAMLWLARVDVRLLLAASASLYVAAQVVPLSMPNFPTGGGWFFNPFAWQLIFTIGLSLGILRLRGQIVPYNRVLFCLALAYIAFAAVWMVASLGGHITYGILPAWMDTLHKSNLPLSRLLHVLALAYVLVHSRAWPWLSRVASADPVLTRFGRNSLPVFVTGSLASMAGYIILIVLGEQNLAVEILITLAGLSLMWTVAMISEIGPHEAARLAAARMHALHRSWSPVTRDHDDVTTTIRRK